MTFSQLEIPFPLFEADTNDASGYVGVRRCSLCGAENHCFDLGIGCAVMVQCPNCDSENGLDADDREETPCRQCDMPIPFPSFLQHDDEIVACHKCLRSGKAAITQDTSYGMISWEQAYAGLTHGVPSRNQCDFELVEDEDGWLQAKLPQEILFDLLRTPTYSSLQGERWQFCCRCPMIFIGRWSRDRFTAESASGQGEVLFNEIVQDVVPGLWEDRLHDLTGIYVFRCPECGRRTAHWDIA
ncbi:MAG TPA: CbrC family protein [Pirellulales bacterium]